MVAAVSADDLVELVRADEQRLATPRASRVRLDPIPGGSYTLRAYREPGDPSVPLDAERRYYVVVGIVTITGDTAEVQATMGEIPREAWDDLDHWLRAHNVRALRWKRHRANGAVKPVERSIN